MPYLKYRKSSHINSLGFHQNKYPKTPFLHFLKYGENKESHVFTIDITIALKKRSQFSNKEEYRPETYHKSKSSYEILSAKSHS